MYEARVVRGSVFQSSINAFLNSLSVHEKCKSFSVSSFNTRTFLRPRYYLCRKKLGTYYNIARQRGFKLNTDAAACDF